MDISWGKRGGEFFNLCPNGYLHGTAFEKQHVFSEAGGHMMQLRYSKRRPAKHEILGAGRGFGCRALDGFVFV